MQRGHALCDIPQALSAALDLPVETVERDPCADDGIDLVVRAGDRLFMVGCKAAATADHVGGGIKRLRRYIPSHGQVVPLLVVPYMGEVGKELCRAEGISWLDLSGNASITAPQLRVRIEGMPNRYKQAGRPQDPFAPRSSRLARALLLSPDHPFTQSELAKETALHRGDISRLVRRYLEAGFVERHGQGHQCFIHLKDYRALLDAWVHAYDFSMHEIRRGHISSRSGIELLRAVSHRFEDEQVPYAATGLAGAWLLQPFATFRVVTLYVEDWPPPQALAGMGYAEETRGSNLWLARPRDEGVFMGSDVKDGIRHVSALQAYLDLKDQPERADEAAAELRRAYLDGNRHDA